jgi:hypothetical protein
MKKFLMALTVFSLSGCVLEQAPQTQPQGPGQTIMQPSFHPTLYVSPGTVGGVSKSTYSVTEIKR